MMGDAHAEDIQKHVRTYIIVFVALAILTVVTVGASYIEMNLTATVALALFIASVKASLVGSYFMHLISEKKLIYWILILTGVFFAAMLLIFLAAQGDQLGKI